MANFFEKNKKKSAGALLLLLLRWRKGVIPLLLLVLLILFMFAAPSNLMATMLRALAGMPYGARPAAAITWMASRLGLGGFGNDQHSFAELLAAMRAARENHGASGINGLMRGGPGGGAGFGDSIGMVRGSLTDVTAGGAGGADGGANLAAKVKGGDSVNGILSPKDAKEEGGGVEIAQGDLSGERAGRVKSAWAEGTGRMSANGSPFAGMDAAGAYAPSWFFSATGHAANPDNVRATLGDKTVPIAGQGATATRRPMNWSASNADLGRAASSVRHYGPNGKALGQLVQGRNAGLMSSSPICTPSGGCPAEYASANIGGIYDGSNLNGTSIGPSSQGTGTSPAVVSGPTGVDGFSTPTIPDPNIDLSGAGDVSGSVPDPAKMQECMDKINECQKQKGLYKDDIMNNWMPKIQDIASRMGGDCSDCCHCGSCDSDKNQISQICNGPVRDDYNKIDAPCQLPSYCTDMMQQGQIQGGTSMQDDLQQNDSCNGAGYNGTSCANSNFLGFCVCS